MQLSDFSFALPEELIAKFPAVPRDHSRLLVVNRETQSLSHHLFYEIPNLLKANDLLVLNNTKVFPARLFGKDSQQRNFEVFLLKKIPRVGSLKPETENTWSCLAKPGKKIKTGTQLEFGEGMKGYIRPDGADAYEITFAPNLNWMDWLYRNGHSPLPPYLKREATEDDKSTYQTVYAKESGSIAAPTAGLHFTPELFENLKSAQISTAELTLHVGYGTFTPIRCTNLLDHQMHAETYEIPKQAFAHMAARRETGNKIVAVGTTTLRALESTAKSGLSFGETSLFITPGYQFLAVDSLITNFHLPESSLFVLVSAFAGIELMQRAYAEAIEQKYRFYSYGDAMLIL